MYGYTGPLLISWTFPILLILRAWFSSPRAQYTHLAHQIFPLIVSYFRPPHPLPGSFHTASAGLLNSLFCWDKPLLHSYQKSHVAQSTKSSKSFLLGQLSHLFVSCIDTLGAETVKLHHSAGWWSNRTMVSDLSLSLEVSETLFLEFT